MMSYYAHHGFKDFVLCLGYRADAIRDYFLNYQETISNDFVLSGGARDIELLNEDISDWRIAFVDTGLRSNIGERLHAVRDLLDGEEAVMANYSDGLSDLPVNLYVDEFMKRDETGCFLSVPPTRYGFHLVESGDQDRVEAFHRMIHDRKLISDSYEGFWHCTDTFNDKQVLEDLDAEGGAPWQIWKK